METALGFEVSEEGRVMIGGEAKTSLPAREALRVREGEW